MALVRYSDLPGLDAAPKFGEPAARWQTRLGRTKWGRRGGLM